MSEGDFLAAQFTANRMHLAAVAYRMLGSRSEADDAVQESFLRLMRTDTSAVANLRGWLTTVVARVCLDVLRSRKLRREAPIGPDVEAVPDETAVDHEVGIADAIGVGMLVVLEELTPAERVAFVLHDMFDVAFDDIAPIINRSPAAARQLASRGRRRVQGGRPVSWLIANDSGKLWARFWQRRAMVISQPCWLCSHPTRCSAPMRRRWQWRRAGCGPAPMRRC